MKSFKLTGGFDTPFAKNAQGYSTTAITIYQLLNLNRHRYCFTASET